MPTQELIIKTKQDAFESGYGRPLTKKVKKLIAECHMLSIKNPKKQFRVAFCKQSQEDVIQCFDPSCDTEWLCLHDGR